MSRVKILVIGPSKAGKSTITNILGGLQEGPSSVYRPTIALRIVDFERDPPPSVSSFGKLNIEFWDVSGDFKYEKCWGPMQKDVNGVIFVMDPNQPNCEEQLNQLVQLFPKAMGLQPKFCMCYVNHHNLAGAQPPEMRIPKSMDALEKHIGTAEDNQGIF